MLPDTHMPRAATFSRPDYLLRLTFSPCTRYTVVQLYRDCLRLADYWEIRYPDSLLWSAIPVYQGPWSWAPGNLHRGKLLRMAPDRMGFNSGCPSHRFGWAFAAWERCSLEGASAAAISSGTCTRDTLTGLQSRNKRKSCSIFLREGVACAHPPRCCSAIYVAVPASRSCKSVRCTAFVASRAVRALSNFMMHEAVRMAQEIEVN